MSTNGEIIGAPGVYRSSIESYWTSFFNTVDTGGSLRWFDTDAARDKRRRFISQLIHDEIAPSDVPYGTHIPVALHWGDTLDEATERVIYYKRLGKGMFEKAGQQAIIFPHGDYAKLRQIDPSYRGLVPQTDFYIVQMPLPVFKKDGYPPTIGRAQHESVRHDYAEKTTAGGVNGALHVASMLARSVKHAKLSSAGLEIQPTDKTSVKVTTSFAPTGPELSEFTRYRAERRLTVLLGNQACEDFLVNIRDWADSKKPRSSETRDTTSAVLSNIDDVLAGLPEVDRN